MTHTPPHRMARSAIFAAVCVCLTAVGHWQVSGEPMPPGVIFGGYLGVWAVAAVLAGHERSLATIVGGLLGGQFTLHALFTAGHVHHHSDVMVPFVSSGHGGGAMVLVHLLAAVASGWWLWRGERALWRLAAAVVLRWLRPARVLQPILSGGRSRREYSEPLRPRAAFLRHILVLRGPPAPVRAD